MLLIRTSENRDSEHYGGRFPAGTGVLNRSNSRHTSHQNQLCTPSTSALAIDESSPDAYEDLARYTGHKCVHFLREIYIRHEPVVLRGKCTFAYNENNMPLVGPNPNCERLHW